MATQSTADWSAIEADFHAGKRSVRQIAKQYGVAESAIRKRAAAHGWVRTGAQGAHHAHQAVAEILPPVLRVPRPIQEDRPTDHVGMGKDLALRLLHELDEITSQLPAVEEAIIDETAEDANGRRRQLMLKAVSLPARSMTLKTLAQALGALQEAEKATGPQGKKAQRQASAQNAASGRFAPPAPPKLVVNNSE